MAIRSGAKGVIAGRIERVGAQMIVTLRLVAPETGDDLAAFRETARDSTQLLSALDAVTKQMRRRIGESLGKVRGSPPMEAVTTSSLLALQKYSQAIKASERGEYEQAQTLLQEAIAIDSGFAMAWRKLGVSYSNQGECGGGEGAAHPGVPVSGSPSRPGALHGDRELLQRRGTGQRQGGGGVARARSPSTPWMPSPPITSPSLFRRKATRIGGTALLPPRAHGPRLKCCRVLQPHHAFSERRQDRQRDRAEGHRRGALPRAMLASALTDAFIAYAQGNYAEAEKVVRALQDRVHPVELRMFALGLPRPSQRCRGACSQATEDAQERSRTGDEPGRAAKSTYNAFTDITVLNAVYRNDPARGKRSSIRSLRHVRLHGVPAEQRPTSTSPGPMPCLGTSRGRGR